MNVGIFCQFNAPFKNVADITVPVMREYADRHGYTLTVHEDRPITRSIVWDRYEILSQEIKNYDWVVHMDADVLITNLHIRLEEFFRGDLVISECLTETGILRMNDGVAMFRNCEDIQYWLQRTFEEPESDLYQCGQDYLENACDCMRCDVTIERHKAINAFLYEEYGMPSTTIGSWSPGDFVLHLPGRTNDRRVELFNQITPQILR
jgi:hypothetical protein